MFKLNLTNLKSAIVYGLLTAFLAVVGYVIEVGDIFVLDWKVLANTGVISSLVVVSSLVKNFLTTDSGNFLGIVKVIPPTK